MSMPTGPVIRSYTRARDYFFLPKRRANQPSLRGGSAGSGFAAEGFAAEGFGEGATTSAERIFESAVGAAAISTWPATTPSRTRRIASLIVRVVLASCLVA